MKKVLTVLITIILILTNLGAVFAIGSLAALNDGKKLSVEIILSAGRQKKDGRFIPLEKGEKIKKDDIITVRVAPKTDFLCGAVCVAVAFDKNYFSIVGANRNAFKANNDNVYFSEAVASYAGSTMEQATIDAKPGENYKLIKANFQANSNSANGGYPEYLTGEWLFSFDLKATKDLAPGSDARIFVSEDWHRTKTNFGKHAQGYFYKVKDRETLSSQGNASQEYMYDFSKADIKLPLTKEQATLPDKPTENTSSSQTNNGTTKPTASDKTTGTKTDKETSGRVPTSTVVYVTDNKGETVTDKDGEFVTQIITEKERTTRIEYVTQPVTDSEGKTVTNQSGDPVYETKYESITVIVTDSQGQYMTKENGEYVYETTMVPVTQIIEEALDETNDSTKDDRDKFFDKIPGDFSSPLKALVMVLVIAFIISGVLVAVRVFKSVGKNSRKK
ncbi:MAG TPA: hypothetical protein PKW24_03790 [Clostridiales bacterium]|nr:hypothetical protein [Clostridiales bacterium]